MKDQLPNARVPKSLVNYSDYSAAEPCGKCTMFRAPSSCATVDGKIDPDGHCKLWDFVGEAAATVWSFDQIIANDSTARNRKSGEAQSFLNPVAKDVTAADVHVSTALGNEEDPRKKKKKRPVQAFIDYSRNVRQVVPEERGPAANAEDGPFGVTQKRYSSARDLPPNVRDRLKGKKRREWMRVWNSEYDAHGDEARAFASAWSAVKKDRSEVLSGEPMVGVGGRRLEPFDAGTFFVPLRYDPTALSQLRPDQVPRVLDALTHPDRLGQLYLPLADLTAIKGRVSRDTIQKHLDRMAEVRGRIGYDYANAHLEGVDDLDPPIVVYLNGAYYVLDGHDRLVAMWLDGVDVVRVSFEDVDAYDDRKPDDDDAHKNTAYALLNGVAGRTLTNYVDDTLAVPFMVDLEFFSHLRPDQVPKFTYALTHQDDLAEATLPLASLVAIQNRVNVDTVAAKVEKPSTKLPVIVRMNSVNYVGDGHDRLTAAWLRGDDDAQVKLTDITWADNSMRPTDLVRATVEAKAKAEKKLAEAEEYVEAIVAQKAKVAEEEAELERALTQKRAEAEEAIAARTAEAEARAVRKRAKLKKKLEEAGLYVQEMVQKRAEADRYEAHKKAEADTLRSETERAIAQKKAELESHEAQRRVEADAVVARAERRATKKRTKLKNKLEEAGLYVREIAEKRAEADRDEAHKKAELERYDARKRTEADDLKRETERHEAKKRVEIDDLRVEAERKATKKRAKLDRKLKEAGLYVREIAEKRAETDRYESDKKAEADRAVADRMDRADRVAAKKRAKLDRRLEEAGLYVQEIDDRRTETQRYVAQKRAEADDFRRETERHEARKRAETDYLRLETERYEKLKRAEADDFKAQSVRSTSKKDEKVRGKLEAADDYVREIARAKRDVARQSARVEDRLSHAEALKKAELERYEIEKKLEIDRIVAETARLAAQAKVEVGKKRKKAARIAEEAEDYVADVVKEKKKAKKRSDDQRSEAEEYAQRVTRKAAKKLAEAEEYVKQVVTEKDKANQKAAKVVAEAERKARTKVDEAERYAADKRLEADKYEVEKKIALDQAELDRRREVAKYELDRMDQMQSITRRSSELLKSGDARMKVNIQKVDQDKHQIFGWASIVTRNGQLVWDKQGDAIPVEELEPAVYQYMLTSRDGGNMHMVTGVSTCIESMMFTKEKQEALGIDLGLEGWWVGYLVHCPELWKSIKSGEIADFSIGGRAVSTKVED